MGLYLQRSLPPHSIWAEIFALRHRFNVVLEYEAMFQVCGYFSRLIPVYSQRPLEGCQTIRRIHATLGRSLLYRFVKRLLLETRLSSASSISS